MITFRPYADAFSDLISDISHTFSVLFPAILYIFRPALSPSPLKNTHRILVTSVMS